MSLDAEAIWEAVTRPNMRLVATKASTASSGPPERQMIALLSRPPGADQGPHTVRPFRATV
jgi:hypothetical protein